MKRIVASLIGCVAKVQALICRGVKPICSPVLSMETDTLKGLFFLNKAETILSPYYYLQQNDIIYVTPNKAKARNSDIGTSTSLWFSATSILVSIASLLFNILK